MAKKHWLVTGLVAAASVVAVKRRRGSAEEIGGPSYPTMLDMTFPEFEAATKRTDVVLIPLGAIEEHGPHLPLTTDNIIAIGQLVDVQHYLFAQGTETIVGPPLNIGITTESDDWSQDGTFMYPGSLTISADTFVALYLDVIRSLQSHGLRHFFLYSGHYGPRHLKVMARIAEEAGSKIPNAKVYALIHGETVAKWDLKPSAHLLPIDRGRNFELLANLLGTDDTEIPTSTHADGAETSEVLHRQPDAVRPSYEELPNAPSSRFFSAYRSGNRRQNPSGMGGFPTKRASAEVGKEIAAARTLAISETILRALARDDSRSHR